MVKKFILLIGCICLSVNIIVNSQNKCDSISVIYNYPQIIDSRYH